MVFPPPRQQHSIYANRINHPSQQPMSFGGQGYPTGSTRGFGGFLRQLIQPNSSVTDVASRGVGGLSNTLNNVQQVLRVVETTAPMVQQYGPMIKNLPMMFKMLKAFKDMESTEESESGIVDESTNELDFLESFESSMSSNKSVERPKTSNRQGNGQSTPKLFI